MSGSFDVTTALPRYVVHQNVLPQDQHAALIDWALSIPDQLISSSLQDRGRVDRSLRNSFSISGDTPPPPWHMILRERFGMLAPRLTRELGLAPFEVADIEFDVVVYNDGSFYGPHIDIAAGPLRRARADRIVTAVYYFHAEPKAFAGGELRLHALGTAQDGSRPHVDIEPVQNSLVAFAASTLHEVRPISCLSGQYRDSRFAINCWIRRARTEGPSHK